MSSTNERIIFRIKVERMLSTYSKEDQENIQKEIECILKSLNAEILSLETVSLIIFYYFKLQELKEKKD